MKISIIIPVLNESASIVPLLKALQSSRKEHEVIVVDGGSRDATVALARPLCDRLVEADAGRAVQMNAGARQASGDVLLFLHADTFLPYAFDYEIAAAIDDGYGWGRFDVRLDGGRVAFRVIEWFMNQRSWLTGICTGDQAIFVSRQLFEELGGFPQQPLMEDIQLSAWLKRWHRPYCSRKTVTSSSRRWEKQGIVKTVLLMWYLRLAYFLGARPDTLVRHYR